MSRRWIGLCAACLVIPGILAAQSATGGPQSGRPASALWHAALAARSAASDTTSDDTVLLRAVDAELALGNPDRARRLLEGRRISGPALAARKIVAAAAEAFLSGAFERSGDLFSQAAAAAESGSQRGMLLARSADAYARAGKAERAATAYHSAREDLAPIDGWLALREAAVTADTTVAFGLLDRVPAAGMKLVPRVRGELFALRGDTARAVVVMAGGGYDGRAAALALASRDSVNARELAYRALRAGDTAVVNAGVALAESSLAPRTPAEFIALARAERRTAGARSATLLGNAVAAGDSSAATLVLWGDVLGESGQALRALDVYTRASRLGGPDGVQAELMAARTMIRVGRRPAASSALETFARAHPDHPSLPLVTYLRADLAQDAGRSAYADSLFGVIMARWPQHDYASQARIRLAGKALARADTSGAAALYRAEIESRGVQQLLARYLLGDIARGKGDSLAATKYWTELVQADSLGYYGSLARGRLGSDLPRVALPDPTGLSGKLPESLVQLDLLDELGFATEATSLVDWLVAQATDANDALDLAEALTARGRTVPAISLGWRAARTLTLNNARVLRAIYPWPLRDVMTAEATEFGVDPYLLAAIVRQESSFDVAARSRAGAQGLMQVMPGTARQAAQRMGLEWSDHLLHVPDANLHVGAAHLGILLRRFGGDLVPTLASYNAGLRPVEQWRRFPEARDPALFVERIPYPETRGYVRSVLRNLTLYRVLYPPGS